MKVQSVSPEAVSRPALPPAPALVNSPTMQSGAKDTQSVFRPLPTLDIPMAPTRRSVVENMLHIARGDVPTLRWANGSPAFAGHIQYGFESEYGLDEADGLLLLYRPTADQGISEETWRAYTKEERRAFVEGFLPQHMKNTVPLPVEKAVSGPEFDFLPASLIVDTTRNVEIIVPPVNTLEDVVKNIRTLGRSAGVGSLQGTLSAPREVVFGVVGQDVNPDEHARALLGFFNFHHLFDSFEKLAAGYERYRKDPTREVARPFAHPWLGPMTRAKQFFMSRFIEANARGEKLDKENLMVVRKADSSFKFVGGTSYRPDIAGPIRTAVEIRDCHKNEDLLVERIVRNTMRFAVGLDVFKSFAPVVAFDSRGDFEKLPEVVQRALPKIIPTAEQEAFADEYSEHERLALQVYRNFALPLKDYSDVEKALGSTALRKSVRLAREAYVQTLEKIATDFEAGTIDKAAARAAVQGALAKFAVDSGIFERLQAWDQRHLVGDRVQAAYLDLSIKGLAPLQSAFPASVWEGPVSERIRRLQDKWPSNVRIVERVGVHFNDPDGKLRRARHPLVVLSRHGLSEAQAEELRRDYLDAMSRGTMSVRMVGDKLQARLGHMTMEAEASTVLPAKYAVSSQGVEAVFALSPLEELRARRQFMGAIGGNPFPTHSPTAWLGELAVGKDGMSFDELTSPKEASAAHKDPEAWMRHVVGTAESEKLATLVRWIDSPVHAFKLAAGNVLEG